MIEADEQRDRRSPAESPPVERVAAVPRVEATNDHEKSFEVVCVRSGVTLTVPAGRSILSVVKEYGIDVFSWCAEGVCGTCETEVLAGLPEHRDSLLTEEEREASKTLLICVSRCRQGPLVLEL